MSDNPRSSLHLTLVTLAIACLAGCSSFDAASNRIVAIASPYKIDVVQGNVVTKEQAAYLKPGMARAQVRDILGTSLLSSVFHADRWDYIFTLYQQGIKPQSRKFTVFFKGDVLERTEGDDLPTEAEFVATLKSPVTTGAVPLLEASEETLRKFPAPNKAAPISPLIPPATDYPPLEAARP